MAANLDALRAQVEATVTVEQSATVLIRGIAAKLEEIKSDPAAIAAFAASLNASATALGDAVVENTPVEPQP